MVETGRACGERTWTFPIDDDFKDDLKSEIADLLQCRITTEADHIYAASFLKHFVSSNVPWIHLDTGSSYRQGGLGFVASDFTGSGVLLGNHLIQDILSGTSLSE